MGALERSMASRVRTVIGNTAQQASDNYKTGGRASADYALHGLHSSLTGIFRSHYRSTADTFGKRIFDAAGKSQGRFERKDAQGSFDQAINSWIAKYTAAKVQSVAETTRRQIIDAISEGEASGAGVDATARLITEQAGGAIARARASIIARTETHAAAMFGSDAAADATGVQGLKREWMAVEDSRTRPTHDQADGQLVGMTEAFMVGGSALERPGDPSGPPEEVIQCRCVVGYQVPGF
jgi:hypothetical protein